MATNPVGPTDLSTTSSASVREVNPFSLKRYSAGTRRVASFGLSLFIVGLIVASIWAPKYWALSTLCSGAFMAVGWGVGFLFGVPRTAATDTRSNTNLEQISDWLTKVLVGVGLTQLQKIPIKLQLLAEYIANDYGQSKSPVFALSMIMYFSALGFLTGYLLTRLALQPEFESNEGGTVAVKTSPTEITVGQGGDVTGKDKGDVQIKTGATEVKIGSANAAAITETKAPDEGDGVEKTAPGQATNVNVQPDQPENNKDE